jgi:hypothetical protein
VKVWVFLWGSPIDPQVEVWNDEEGARTQLWKHARAGREVKVVMTAIRPNMDQDALVNPNWGRETEAEKIHAKKKIN